MRRLGGLRRPFSSVSARGYDPTRSLFLPPASLFRAGKLGASEGRLGSSKRGRGGPAMTVCEAERLALRALPIFPADARPWASTRSMLATDEMRRLARRGAARLAETLSTRGIDKDATLATGVLTPYTRVLIANAPKPGQVVDGRVTPPRKKELVGDEARDRIVKAFGAFSPQVRTGAETALNTRLVMDERANERVLDDEFHEMSEVGPRMSRAVMRSFAVAGDVAQLALKAQAMGYHVTAAPAPAPEPALPAAQRRGPAKGLRGQEGALARLRDFKLAPFAVEMAVSTLEDGDVERPGSYPLPFKPKFSAKGAPLEGERKALAGKLAMERSPLLRIARRAFMSNGVDVGPFSTPPHLKSVERAVRKLRMEKGKKDFHNRTRRR